MIMHGGKEGRQNAALLVAAHVTARNRLLVAYFQVERISARDALAVTPLRDSSNQISVLANLVYTLLRRKFTTSVQPAKAYEDESVITSGPHSQWPKS